MRRAALAAPALVAPIFAAPILAAPILAALLLCLPVAAATAATPAGAGPGCEGGATVALARAGVLALADVALDGRPARFVLDTGSVRTVVSPRAAAALGLAPDPWASGALRGLGGIDRHRDVTVTEVTLGRTPLGRALGAVRTLGVAALPPAVGGVPVDGLLGLDLLAMRVLAIDLGRDALTLLPAGCPDEADSLAADPDTALFVVAATFGGRPLRALIDTGAETTILSDRAADRLGLAAAAAPAGGAAHDTATGIGPGRVRLRTAHGGMLALGRTRLGDGPVSVGPLPAGGFDLVLGMDRLARTRLRLDRARHRVSVDLSDTE